MKADESNRVSVAFPDKVKNALIRMKEKTRASYNGYINLAIEEKLRKEGYLRK